MDRELDSLLRGVIDDPDDALAAQAYADRLEELGGEGNTTRAAFIRVQVMLESMGHGDPRRRRSHAEELRLLHCNKRRWASEVCIGLAMPLFRRGFLSGATARVAWLLRMARRIFDRSPLRELALLGVGTDKPDRSAEVRRLADCKQLVRLRALALPGSRFRNLLDDAILEALSGSPHLGGVQRLDLSGNRLTAQGVRALAGSAMAGSLTELDLSGNNVGQDGAGLVAGAMPRLTKLSFAGNVLGTGGAVAIAGSPPMSGLEVLGLAGCGLGDEGAAAIATSGHLARLRELDLSRNGIGDAAARALLAIPAELVRLDLRGNRVSRTLRGDLRARFGKRVHFRWWHDLILTPRRRRPTVATTGRPAGS